MTTSRSDTGRRDHGPLRRAIAGSLSGCAHFALVELLGREGELFEAGAFAGHEVARRQRLPVARARTGWGVEGSVGEAAQTLQLSASWLY